MRHRQLATAGAVVWAALGAGACGGSDAGDRPQGAGERAQDGALRFARCIREHGVNMPDPEVGGNGMVKIAPGPGQGDDMRPENPKVRRAMAACEKHLPQGGPGEVDEQQAARFQDDFVRYARCMREHGVNMPDPGPNGGFVFKRGDPKAPDPESPAFKRADRECHHLLAEADEAVEGEGSE